MLSRGVTLPWSSASTLPAAALLRGSRVSDIMSSGRTFSSSCSSSSSSSVFTNGVPNNVLSSSSSSSSSSSNSSSSSSSGSVISHGGTSDARGSRRLSYSSSSSNRSSIIDRSAMGGLLTKNLDKRMSSTGGSGDAHVAAAVKTRFATLPRTAPDSAVSNAVKRIVFTGGPCGGKSTSMTAVAKTLNEAGIRTYQAPEMATIMISNGAPFDPKFTPAQVYAFQRSLLRGIIALEDAFFDVAMSIGEPAVVLCDRGAMDASAYMAPAMWKSLLDEEGYNEVWLRDRRYDAVIHLKSAACGIEKAYTLSNNAARTETASQARALDERLRQVWMGHPHHRVVDNYDVFHDKVRKVTEIVSRFMSLPIQGKGLRKFIVKGSLPESIPSLSFDIEDHYSNSGRVRRRTHSGVSSFVFSHIEQYGPTDYAIIERPISARDYSSIANAALNKIEKKRLVFFHNNGSFQLDTYLAVNGESTDLVVLQIEVESPTEAVDIPPYLTVVKEITDDQEYNYYSKVGLPPVVGGKVAGKNVHSRAK